MSPAPPTSPPGVQLVTPVMGPPGRSNSTSKVPATVASENASRLMRARSTGHDALTKVDVDALKRVSADPTIPPPRRQSTLSLRSFNDSEYAELQFMSSGRFDDWGCGCGFSLCHHIKG